VHSLVFEKISYRNISFQEEFYYCFPVLDQTWMNRFIHSGGLKHLFSIFLNGSLQSRDGSVWCEWKQDCLSCLLKLLVQFGVDPQDYEALADQVFETIL